MVSKEVIKIAIEKELDKKWYWLGYACGSNTRKRIKEMPDKITNLGDRGIELIPTETQKASFFIGMLVGRGKVVQNFDLVELLQYQDKKSRKKGDYLTLGMTEVKSNRGQTVRMPLIISNNTVDNRGYIGFQAKISYPTTYLTFTNLIQSNPNLTTLRYQHDAAAGIVLVQGLMDSVSYSDAVQVYLEFVVSVNCPYSQTISVLGPTGQGTASDILTLISGENYYIQPVILEDGLIKIPDQETGEYKPTIPYTEDLPPIGDEYTYLGENTDLSYNFDLTLSYGGSASGGGSGSGSGASLGVRIGFGDGSSQVVYIPLQEGSHNYSGKIPLNLPYIKHGPIKIEIWVEPEDEDDLYYWFIKAGALWSFDTDIPRNDVGEFEDIVKQRPKTYYETLTLKDAIEFVFEGITPILDIYYVDDSLLLSDSVSFEFEGSPPTPVSELEITEIMQIIDSFEYEIIRKSGEYEDTDGCGLVDEVIFEFE